jgi:hypothetical protein
MRCFLFIVLLISGIAGSAKPKKELASDDLNAKGPVKIEKDTKVWMLTYFRQRYPTRIEIDSTGKTVEVPLPDPMQVEKLHLALSTDGRLVYLRVEI